MANENCTVKEILDEMRDAANKEPSAIKNDNHLLTDWYYDDECQGWLTHYANRIESAYGREIEHCEGKYKDACLCTDEYQREAADLRRLLKIAEDALEMVATENCCDCQRFARNALAEIQKEGRCENDETD